MYIYITLNIAYRYVCHSTTASLVYSSVNTLFKSKYENIKAQLITNKPANNKHQTKQLM